MECGLIQELLDAHKIIEQVQNLNTVLMTRGSKKFTVKDWFCNHPLVMRQLKLSPQTITYTLVNQRLNQTMADLF